MALVKLMQGAWVNPEHVTAVYRVNLEELTVSLDNKNELSIHPKQLKDELPDGVDAVDYIVGRINGHEVDQTLW
jgi:hypothetical protein